MAPVPGASRTDEFVALLERRGAELSRLRDGRGVIACVLPGHADHRPSLSLDTTRAIFHCFGCERGGGVMQLRELVGDGPAHATPRAHASPHRNEADDDAHHRRLVLRRAVEKDRRLQEAWGPLWRCGDYIRNTTRLARTARQCATALGPDDPRTWPLLERAAAVERGGRLVDAELDAILAEGRIA